MGDFTVNAAQLASIQNALEKLQKQLPSHQVAALRRSGPYLAQKMRGHAAVMHYDGAVEKSIDWREEHGVSGGQVTGGSAIVVIGPGAKGKMPIHAPLMETGWKAGWWPNMTRLGAWAARRIPMISSREVFYIARSLAARGALSRNNPRAGGQDGYHYVEKTFSADGPPALQTVLDGAFGEVKSALEEIR